MCGLATLLVVAGGLSALAGVFCHGSLLCPRGGSRLYDSVHATLISHVGLARMRAYDGASSAPAARVAISQFLVRSRDIDVRAMNAKLRMDGCLHCGAVRCSCQ